MTPQGIKKRILDHMQHLLGTYAPPQMGTTVPAIYIGENTPSEWNVSGIECVIHRTPRIQRLTQFGGDCDRQPLPKQEYYDVVLKRWDNSMLLLPAMDKLLELYPSAESAQPLPETNETLEQATITLRFLSDIPRNP